MKTILLTILSFYLTSVLYGSTKTSHTIKIYGTENIYQGFIPMENGKAKTPFTLTCDFGDITIYECKLKNLGTMEEELIVFAVEGYIKKDRWVKLRAGEDGVPKGKFEVRGKSSKGKSWRYEVENWVEGGETKGKYITESFTWVGGLKTQKFKVKRHGEGVQTYESGAEFTGTYDYGKRKYGTMKYSTGKIYVGEFNGAKGQGKGKITYPSGNKYEGGIKNTKPEGEGTMIYAEEGDKYVGSFQNGRRHGQGKYTYQDGSWYEGGFEKGKEKGKGKGYYKYKNGASYEGEFYNGKRSGQGTYSYSDGSKYSGGWSEGKKSGYGVYNDVNGDYYKGNWSENEKSGKGEGIWSYENAKYTGEMVDGVPHGFGLVEYTSGSKYIGELQQGFPWGNGKKTLPDGTVQSGRFQKGQFLDGNNTASNTSTTNYGTGASKQHSSNSYSPPKCECEFEETGNSSTKDWYRFKYYNASGAVTSGNLEVRYSETDNKSYEHFKFTFSGKTYQFKYTETDISDYFNTEGKLLWVTGFMKGEKIGQTTNEDLAMRLMLKKMFGSSCGRIEHDY